MVQLVESAHYQTAMPEEYVMIMETDHMLMHAPPNVATEQKPAGRRLTDLPASPALPFGLPAPSVPAPELKGTIPHAQASASTT